MLQERLTYATRHQLANEGCLLLAHAPGLVLVPRVTVAGHANHIDQVIRHTRRRRDDDGLSEIGGCQKDVTNGVEGINVGKAGAAELVSDPLG